MGLSATTSATSPTATSGISTPPASQSPRQAGRPGELHRHRVLAVDVNADHLACWVLDASGEPAGKPVSVPLELVGGPAYTRDGHLRTAISGLLHMARRRAAGRS